MKRTKERMQLLVDCREEVVKIHELPFVYTTYILWHPLGGMPGKAFTFISADDMRRTIWVGNQFELVTERGTALDAPNQYMPQWVWLGDVSSRSEVELSMERLKRLLKEGFEHALLEYNEDIAVFIASVQNT